MNRNFVIGIKGQKMEPVKCGCTDNEAFEAAHKATGYDAVEVYLQVNPHSVVDASSRAVAKARLKEKADNIKAKKEREAAEKKASAPEKPEEKPANKKAK